MYLKTLHEPEPKEEGEEEKECSPSWYVVPEACLLLYNGIERADAGEDQQERRDEEPGVVQTLGLGELHHPLGAGNEMSGVRSDSARRSSQL